MLLNEPTPHQARPAAATAAAPGGTRELPPVEVDGAPTPARASSAQADAESPSASSAQAPTVRIVTVGGGADALATVALDVDAVKRALAEGRAAADATDATDTVSLDVEGVKQALDISADSAPAEIDADAEPVAEDAQDSEDSSAESSNDAGPADLTADASTDASADTAADASADLVPAADPSADPVPAPGTEPDHTTGSYLASTDLSTSVSTLVAVPETADDVIATIHAAATVVAEADRRARRAAVAKADPWTGLDLHQPAAPEPVDDVLDLLSPVLERPLLVVEQPGPPAPADVMALHRSELELDFVEPPVVAAGAEPPIPPRYGPGLSVLPHIDFPV